ncbi:MAG: hypothetical protein R2713_08605 [Ilumatobacteraceae bacterium]
MSAASRTAISTPVSGSPALIVPTIPSLPRRSTAEGLIVQAMLGIEGVTVGQYGAISVDVPGRSVGRRHHRRAPRRACRVPAVPRTRRRTPGTPQKQPGVMPRGRQLRCRRERRAGRAADRRRKWRQLVGPVSLGLAPPASGRATGRAFEVAAAAVRSHVQSLLDAVDAVAGVPAARVHRRA